MDPREDDQKIEEPIMNKLESPSASFFTSKLIIVLVIVAGLGIASGYLLSKKGTTGLGSGTNISSVNSSSSGKNAVGSSDTKTFKDTATGIMKAGGIDGEGAYHLVRPGGESQNVYLTSSIVDLSTFIDKKVKVWGETQSAKHAGWLMDVGRVEVLQ